MTWQKERPPVLTTPAAQERLGKYTSVESAEHTPVLASGQRRQDRPLHLSYSVAAAVTTIASRGIA